MNSSSDIKIISSVTEEILGQFIFSSGNKITITTQLCEVNDYSAGGDQ
jgi:hypothetical protein